MIGDYLIDCLNYTIILNRMDNMDEEPKNQKEI